MPPKPKLLTEEQIKQIRESPNYAKTAEALGISEKRAKAIKIAASLEEALSLDGGNEKKTPEPKEKKTPEPKEKTVVRTSETGGPLDSVQAELSIRTLRFPMTPIMRSAYRAAILEFDYPRDMHFEDFIDTALYVLFKERGIILEGYYKEEDDHANNRT